MCSSCWAEECPGSSAGGAGHGLEVLVRGGLLGTGASVETGSIISWTELGTLGLEWWVHAEGSGLPLRTAWGAFGIRSAPLEVELCPGEGDLVVGGGGLFPLDLSDLGCSVSWAPCVCGIFKQQFEKCLSHRLRGPVPVSSHVCLWVPTPVCHKQCVRHEFPFGWPRNCRQLGGTALSWVSVGKAALECSEMSGRPCSSLPASKWALGCRTEPTAMAQMEQFAHGLLLGPA